MQSRPNPQPSRAFGKAYGGRRTIDHNQDKCKIMCHFVDRLFSLSAYLFPVQKQPCGMYSYEPRTKIRQQSTQFFRAFSSSINPPRLFRIFPSSILICPIEVYHQSAHRLLKIIAKSKNTILMACHGNDLQPPDIGFPKQSS
jgi:hypothetical protein